MNEKKKRTPKQIAALICVIILAGMYLITLIVACLDIPGSGNLFAACLLATIGLPILLWLYLWLYGLMRDRSAAAAADIVRTEPMNGDSVEVDYAQNDSIQNNPAQRNSDSDSVS